MPSFVICKSNNRMINQTSQLPPSRPSIGALPIEPPPVNDTKNHHCDPCAMLPLFIATPFRDAQATIALHCDTMDSKSPITYHQY